MSERKIVNYKRLSDFGQISISCDVGPIDLDNAIKEHLKCGWILYGYPFSNAGICYQAMVKYED